MQPQNSQQALSALQTAQKSAQDPNTILSAQNEQLGVNNAQNTVTGLRGAINNTTKLLSQVAPSVMGRTGSSLVTNAQAGKQIQNEQAPISANLTQEGTDYNNANSDLGILRQQAQTAASGIYQGQQDKLSYAQNLYNTLYGQEQDVAHAAEQKREFDANQASQAAATAAANKQFALTSGGNNSTPTTPQGGDSNSKTLTGGKSLNDAATSLKQLLATKNPGTITNTLKAIEASAKYGNTYDQAKLQFINSQPEFSQYLANINNVHF
jgi:hypothetical protein